MTSKTAGFCPAHNVFQFANGVIFSSNFDNGNLADVEEGNKSNEYHIWTSPDAAPPDAASGSQSKNNAWFHFCVTGLTPGSSVKINVQNASNHSGLYKHDMRPVFRCKSSNNKWGRIRTPVKYEKREGGAPKLSWEHQLQEGDDKVYFCFTYPYTYTMVQEDLNAMNDHQNRIDDPTGKALYWHRELLTTTRDGNRLDLVTISACNGIDNSEKEPLFDGIFPDAKADGSTRPYNFPEKQILWVSGRVHPGEVPAQHTIKGIFDLLLDEGNVIAQELRKRYVFKIVPIINPDGVIRGHFRMDQFGQNLNRYYSNPQPDLQAPIFAIKKLLDHYADRQKLALYLDCHAHASKRGCFIYGNVLDSVDDQIQNMLYCRLIALNTPHFDYEGCLFSREHMTRIDPGDRGAGLTAEGSGRVSTYLHYNLVHSYTLECNYNSSKSGNEVPPCEHDPLGDPTHHLAHSTFTTYPEKYTPTIWQGVGRACVVAMLDLRNQNPCGRIPKSKAKTLSRYRHAVAGEVRQRKEYKSQRGRVGATGSSGYGSGNGGSQPVEVPVLWRRCISGVDADTISNNISDAAPTLIDWASMKPRSAPTKPSQVLKATDSSSIKQMKRSGSSGGGGASDTRDSRLSTQKYENKYVRERSTERAPEEAAAANPNPNPNPPSAPRPSNVEQAAIDNAVAVERRDPKATVAAMMVGNGANGRAVSGYLAPANIDLLPDAGALRPRRDSSSSLKGVKTGGADLGTSNSGNLLPRPHGGGDADDLSIGAHPSEQRPYHASSGSGGANASVKATASAAGSIKFSFDEPSSPGSKERRSNRAPRASPSKQAGTGSGEAVGGSTKHAVSKSHPLTSAYNSSGISGKGKGKAAAALTGSVTTSSRGILAKNLTAAGMLKLSKQPGADNVSMILKSPVGSKSIRRRVGALSGNPSALPPAQASYQSNGYSSDMPPPRSGGSHSNVMAEIKRVMTNDIYIGPGSGGDSRGNSVGSTGKSRLKSNIPKLSRLDTSSLKSKIGANVML